MCWCFLTVSFSYPNTSTEEVAMNMSRTGSKKGITTFTSNASEVTPDQMRYFLTLDADFLVLRLLWLLHSDYYDLKQFSIMISFHGPLSVGYARSTQFFQNLSRLYQFNSCGTGTVDCFRFFWLSLKNSSSEGLRSSSLWCFNTSCNINYGILVV